MSGYTTRAEVFEGYRDGGACAEGLRAEGAAFERSRRKMELAITRQEEACFEADRLLAKAALENGVSCNAVEAVRAPVGISGAPLGCCEGAFEGARAGAPSGGEVVQMNEYDVSAFTRPAPNYGLPFLLPRPDFEELSRLLGSPLPWRPRLRMRRIYLSAYLKGIK